MGLRPTYKDENRGVTMYPVWNGEGPLRSG
jgi:hypothetical protein